MSLIVCELGLLMIHKDVHILPCAKMTQFINDAHCLSPQNLNVLYMTKQQH